MPAKKNSTHTTVADTPKTEFTNEEWRKLAEEQNNSGQDCANAEETITWFMMAIDSLLHIPEKNFVDDDWRNLAGLQNYIGQNSSDHDQELTWYIRALSSLTRISDKDFSDEDWRDLANYQSNLASISPNMTTTWYHEAINSLTHINQQDFTEEDWRNLALYQNNVAHDVADPTERQTLYVQAISSLNHIQQNHFTPRDWSNLARNQNNIGFESSDPAESKNWYSKAIDSLAHIPENEFKPKYWQLLAKYHTNLASAYKDLQDWNKAQQYFAAALNAHLKGQKIDYEAISEIYSDLSDFTLEYSLEYYLYEFANIVFSDAQLSFESPFLQLHREILRHSYQNNNLLLSWLQLMRLLEIGMTQLDFPNRTAMEWMTEHQQLFTQMLRSAEEACQPLSLLKLADQAPSLGVAVAYKLSLLDETIANLNERIASLEKENEQLRTAQGYYQNQLTLFEKNVAAFNKEITEKENIKLLR